jgi:anion-transporting  ArsA/GET3 family ATPase
MELHRFCSTSRVMLVAGKGGVGKTTVTATLATAAARTGASVLIVEVEGKSGLATCFGVAELGYDATEIRPSIRARELTPDEALVEYLDERGLRSVSRRLARTGTLDVVATAVPGMRDILVLGKVKQLEQARDADLILVDTPASGHAVSFLRSPLGLADSVRAGVLRSQAREVIDLLTDPSRAQVILVTRPEETPVNELVDTAFALEDQIGVTLGPVIVNGMPPDLGLAGHTTVQDALRCGLEISAPEAVALDLAAQFAGERRSLADEQANQLAARLPLAQVLLPLIDQEIGPSQIEHLADELTTGVGLLAETSPRAPR